MKEKVLIIYIRDLIYAERLMNRCNENRTGLKAVMFSDPAALDDYIESGERKPDCILLDEDTFDQKLGNKATVYKVLTKDDPLTGSFSMYCSADILLGAVAKELSVEEQAVPEHYGRIITWFSLYDDGKSAAAAIDTVESIRRISDRYPINRQGAGTDERQATGSMEKQPASDVLLIGFSPFGSIYTDKEHGNGLSALFYALSAGAQADPEQYAVHTEAADVICGVSYVRDIDEFTVEAAEKLARMLENSRYRNIVIDAGPLRGFSPVFINACDRLSVIKTGNADENDRLEEYLKELAFAGFTCGEKLKEAYI